MRILNWIVDFFTLVFFTLMVVIDYFPNIGMEMKLAVIGGVVSILLSVLIRKKGGSPFQSGKKQFILTILLGGYLFLLFQILTKLGGASQSGIGIDDPLIWFVYIFSVFLAFRKYKKEYRDSD